LTWNFFYIFLIGYFNFIIKHWVDWRFGFIVCFDLFFMKLSWSYDQGCGFDMLNTSRFNMLLFQYFKKRCRLDCFIVNYIFTDHLSYYWTLQLHRVNPIFNFFQLKKNQQYLNINVFIFKINYPTSTKSRVNDQVLAMLEGGFKNDIRFFLQQTRNLYVHVFPIKISHASSQVLIYTNKILIKKHKN